MVGSFFSRLKRLPKVLSPLERIFILLAGLALIVSLVGFYRNNQRNYIDVAASGGEFVEGIVANKASEVNIETADLVYSSLIKYSEKQEVIGQLAESYSISDDGKTYTFPMKKGVNIPAIVSQLEQSKSLPENSKVEGKDGKVIISVISSFGPLLLDLTTPNLKPGPYNIIKETTKEVNLTSNPDFVMGKPYIPSIKLKIYPTKGELSSALNRGQVMAASGIEGNIKDFMNYSLTLPQYMMLFFNLNRSPWDNIDDRRKLAKNESFSDRKTLTITHIEGELESNQINSLKKRFTPLNIEVKEKIVSQVELDKDILPNHNFEALLYGIDLGRDPDPFIFWHSSQIDKGQNLSGFKSKAADKLLEQARLLTDFKQRQDKYQELHTILDDQVPALQLDQIKLPYLVSDKVKGIVIGTGVTVSDRFNNVWQWYIKTQKAPKKK